MNCTLSALVGWTAGLVVNELEHVQQQKVARTREANGFFRNTKNLISCINI